jgi:hypothetical protein
MNRFKARGNRQNGPEAKIQNAIIEKLRGGEWLVVVTHSLLTVGAVLLISGVVGYTCYVEGYRRGCQDTLSVVENRADKLMDKVEKRLFGCLN